MLSSPDSLARLFASFEPRIAGAPIEDFSRLHKSAAGYCEVAPQSAEETSAIVSLAAANQIPIRVRGNGHALNGSSLPRPGELCLSTARLSALHSPSDEAIVAGAGLILWKVNEHLSRDGLSLPVTNDGYAGPSVGGFVAAGGFGPGSATAGGFWNNVSNLAVVNGKGELQTIASSDPLFPWFFGSMGQLGVVVEATLELARNGSERASLTQAAGPKEPLTLGEWSSDPAVMSPEAGLLFWFTLFVPQGAIGEASEALGRLEDRAISHFDFRDRYTYLIRRGRIIAPLIWPHPSSCYAVGSWGIQKPAGLKEVEELLTFDAAVLALAIDHGYRRYVQSEIPAGPRFYRRYFGDELYKALWRRKRAQDPQNILNRGWVFDGSLQPDECTTSVHGEPASQR